MHKKRPFRTRKGDDGFNPPRARASKGDGGFRQGSAGAHKGDGGFRQPAQLAYRARRRHPWAVAGPGRASRRRAERSSQRGRLAGGPPPTGTQSSPAQQGTHSSPPQRAAGASGARNTSGATCHLGITKPPGPTGAGRLSQFRKLSAESRQCRGLRGRSPGGRWKYRAWKQRPSRFPPCGGPRRRRWRSAWPSRRRSRRRCLRSQPG